MNKLLLAALLLVGCGEKERLIKQKEEWDNAQQLEVERYVDKSNYHHGNVSTFIMDGHKIIVYHTSYGARMVAIPLDQDAKVKELEEYIFRLEEENQLLGSLLAEKEIKEDE